MSCIHVLYINLIIFIADIAESLKYLLTGSEEINLDNSVEVHNYNTCIHVHVHLHISNINCTCTLTLHVIMLAINDLSCAAIVYTFRYLLDHQTKFMRLFH